MPFLSAQDWIVTLPLVFTVFSSMSISAITPSISLRVLFWQDEISPDRF